MKIIFNKTILCGMFFMTILSQNCSLKSEAEMNGRVSAVEIGTIKSGTFNNTATHEIGHNLGLDHKTGGLMDPIANNSFTTSSRERGETVYNQVGPLQGNGIYKDSKQNTLNYNTSIQSQARNFISKNNIKE